MVFNGLGKSDLIIYNVLRDMFARQPDADALEIRARELAMTANCHEETVRRALNRLETYEIIERDRPGVGHPYSVRLVE